MADDAVVHIGENSPEQVAYKLMMDITNVEGRDFFGDNPADRAYILDTYVECTRAIRGAARRNRAS